MNRGAVYASTVTGTIITSPLPPCCPQRIHDALKADPVAWAAAPFVGVQHYPDGALELRNCRECGCTLAMPITDEET